MTCCAACRDGKLDTIKEEIAWWEAGVQPPQLPAAGEVMMITAWSGRIYDADKNDRRNFKMVWDGEIPTNATQIASEVTEGVPYQLTAPAFPLAWSAIATVS